ncbi:MAG: efflux RND transporter permease subunit [Kiritimatiellia bacterium]
MKTSTLALGMLLAFTGCTFIGPQYQEKAVASVLDDSAVSTSPRNIDLAPADVAAPKLDLWWNRFGDESLTRLLAKAFAANHTLESARANLRAARAQYDYQRGALWPAVDIGADVTRSSASDNMPTFMKRTTDYKLAGDASWEVDLFGRQQRVAAAAEAQAEAAEADLKSMWVSISSEVALRFLELRTLQARLFVANDNLRVQQETYDILSDRYNEGIGDALAKYQAEYNLRSTAAKVPQIQAQMTTCENALAILCGVTPGTLPIKQFPEVTPPTVQILMTYPGATAANLEETIGKPLEAQIAGMEAMLYMKSACANNGLYTLTVTFAGGSNCEMNKTRVQECISQIESKLPVEVKQQGIRVITSLPIDKNAKREQRLHPTGIPQPEALDLEGGIPADAIRNRPDVISAERALKASVEMLASAEAERYPRVYISGSLGLEALHVGDVFDWDSHFYRFGPGISLPIFHGGQINANIEIKTEQQKQALSVYEHTVLTALGDIRNALSDYRREQERLASLRLAVEAAANAYDVANDKYQKGLTDFNNVLDAQRNMLSLDESRVISEGTIAQAQVKLYKALCGSWENTDDATLANYFFGDKANDHEPLLPVETK